MSNWFDRLRHNLPVINYAEEGSEEDLEEGLDFEDPLGHSPLVSPRRPVQTREGSPQILAHPTLNDNVDEDLEDVAWKLHDINQVEEEIDELTDLLVDTDTKVGDDVEEVGEEVGSTRDAPKQTLSPAPGVTLFPTVVSASP